MAVIKSNNKNKSTGSLSVFEALGQRLRQRHLRHYRDSYFHLWADLLLVSILIGLVIMIVSLLFWQPEADFILKANIDSSRVISGEVQSFSILYQNKEAGPVNAFQIHLDFPKQYTFISTTSADTYNQETRTFSIGDLPEGAKGSITVRGIIIGAPAERQAIKFSGSYYYGGGRKQLLETLSYDISAAALELNLSVPEKVYQRTDVGGVIEIKNTAQVPISNILLTFPEKSFEVVIDAIGTSDNEGKIDVIAPGETKKIDFTINGSEVGDTTLTAEVLLQRVDDSIRQVIKHQQITISAPNLSVVSSIISSSVSAVNSGGKFNLTFLNNEESALEDISFTLLSSRDEVEVTNLHSETKNVFARGNSLLVPTLNAHKKAEVEASFILERKAIQVEDKVRLNIRASYKMNGQEFEFPLTLGTIKFNSNLTLLSDGYYYGPQGDQLGVGPIPPRVDIPTTYWIIWQVNNLGNDVNNLKVTADLPLNVIWTDQKSLTSGTVEYSPVTRRVSWQPEKIARGGGNYRASFAVSLIPHQEDIGQIPVLLDNISFSGLDSFSNTELTKSLPAITTNLENDRLSAGKGRVEESE